MEQRQRRRPSTTSHSEEDSFPFLATLSSGDRTFDDVSEISDLSATISLPFSTSTLEDASLFAARDLSFAAEDVEDLFSDAHRDAMRLTRQDLLALTDDDERRSQDLEELVFNLVAGVEVNRGAARSPVAKALQELGESCRLRTRPEAEDPTTHRSSSSDDDDSSELWRLLDSNKDFRITQPGYDAFDEDCPHWLQSQPLPWSSVDTARAKCVAWLDKYFQ